MSNATGPLAATSPRPYTLKAAVAALAGIGLLSTASVWAQEAVAADAKPLFTPALDARAAFIVGDILSDGNARARTFGTDSVLATRFWSAVKTGTSKDMRDNWAVGWSERYTVGVWVGNASGDAMHDVSGTSGAAPIWAKLYRPAQLEAGKKYPIVMFAHGAGYLQNTTKRYPVYFREQMFHNLLVEQGYIVLDVDYRASLGYGSAWRTASWRPARRGPRWCWGRS